jgi:DNA-binding CsgD family transcriptional regulator
MFVVPLALIGWVWGLRAAVGAAVLAEAVVVVWAVFAHAGFEVIGYLTRATVFLTVAVLASVAGRRATPAVDGGGGLEGFSLTAREAEVLKIMAEGASNAEIGRRLSISESTAKTHVKSVLRKLGVTNRTQAVSLYLEYRTRGDSHGRRPGLLLPTRNRQDGRGAVYHPK